MSAAPVKVRGAGFGLDAELAKKAADKYDPELERVAQQWIEAVLGEPFPGPFSASLKNGQILCRFINAIKPGTVKKVETSGLAFKQMENVSNFIKGCRALGVPEFELFETVDLYEEKDLGVVVTCILALGRQVKTSVPTFAGPFPAVQHRRNSSQDVHSLERLATDLSQVTTIEVISSAPATAPVAATPPPPPTKAPRPPAPVAAAPAEPEHVKARGAGFGMDAELAARREASYDVGLEGNVRAWIEAVLGEPFPDASFSASLKDGQILCKFINAIKPGSVKSINNSKMPFKQMENITSFIKACRAIGVPEFDLFETVDLYEEKDIQVVLRCLDSLGRTVQRTVPEFQGPHFGVRMATENKREFAPEVLQKQVVMTKIAAGSAATMERLSFDKSRDVTFGADHAGTGLFDGATRQTAGDAGHMERLHTDKSRDITFGHDSAKS